MADRLLDGVLGGEDENSGENIAKAVVRPEAYAGAVAANPVNQNPAVAQATVAFLEQQTKLLRVQKLNAQAEHEFFEAERRPRLLVVRLRAGFQLFFALFASVIGVGIAVVVVSAIQSRSVVIEPFEAPPALAASGLSGKVLASGLLDVLTRIQAATRTSAARRSLSNAWTNDIEIEVPETGISIGKLERMLKMRFGHDQYIDGDLVQTASGGLSLTVRGTGILARTFTDDSRDLDRLLTQAGEYVYGQSQPGLWVAYLSNNNRNEEAVNFARAVYATVEASERPYLLNYWANAISSKGGEGPIREALALYRESIRLKPDFWVGYNNIMYALNALGDEEGMARVGQQLLRTAGGRPGRAPEGVYQNYDSIVWDLPAQRADQIADMETHGGVGTTTGIGGSESLSVAVVEAQLHDVDAATIRLKTTPIDETNEADVASAALARALLSEEKGDLNVAATEWDTYAAAYAHPTVAAANPANICRAALTYEKTGQRAKADAVFSAVGALKLVDCYRFKGDVIDARGDWAGAQQWYAKAVQLGPSLPAGYYAWGAALARHGDLGAAAEKLKDANARGPHWADPLKTWGDVLVKLGKPRDAIAKYDEALTYAPNWTQAKVARQEAALKH